MILLARRYASSRVFSTTFLRAGLEIKNDDGGYCYKPNDHTGANMVVSELEGDPTFSSRGPELVLQALADALIDAGVKC